jgi:hypothetical protein
MPDIAHTWTEHTYTEPFDDDAGDPHPPGTPSPPGSASRIIWQCYGYALTASSSFDEDPEMAYD